MERDLYHGHFCYDNEHQFHFEVICTPLMETFHQKAVRKTTHFYGGLRNLSTEIILKLKVRKDKFCHRIFGLRAGCSDKLC